MALIDKNKNTNMELYTEYDNYKTNEFIGQLRSFRNMEIVHTTFIFGNVRRLDVNNKFIYLWQNVKGDIHYSFNIFEKEYYTTTASKLGNVLSQHFGSDIGVVNNEKEKLKKMINATAGLNKALSDVDRHNSFANYGQQNQYITLPDNSSNDLDTKEQIYNLLDSKPNNTDLQVVQNQPHYNQQPSQYNNPYSQESLFQSAIQLNTYNLDSHINTIYIKLDELPIIHKEIYLPSVKQAFYTDNNGLNIRNKFIPSSWMVYQYNMVDPSQSFTIVFILFMAKNNIHQAMQILVWIADSFTSLDKLSFVLVLQSQEDEYMKLLYEEILEKLFNDFQCEKIENNDINSKSFSSLLDEKAICNFHNISTPTILNDDAYEFTNRLIHKDNLKINRKGITTLSNVLITSTSKYIPMISDVIPSAIVKIEGSVKELCKHYNIKPNKNTIAQYIKNDLPNFVATVRALDITKIVNSYPIVDDNIDNDLIDGATDVAEVFNELIREKEIMPFESVSTTKASKKLVEKLNSDFKINRIDKASLLDYFELLFGKGIYKSNTAFISTLRKDYSSTGEPFDNEKTYVRSGRGYYFL